MADFAQAVKWMQEGKVVFRESYEWLEYSLESCLGGRGRAMVMRHMPDYDWEDLVLIEPDLIGQDWECKLRRKPRKQRAS